MAFNVSGMMRGLGEGVREVGSDYTNQIAQKRQLDWQSKENQLMAQRQQNLARLQSQLRTEEAIRAEGVDAGVRQEVYEREDLLLGKKEAREDRLLKEKQTREDRLLQEEWAREDLLLGKKETREDRILQEKRDREDRLLKEKRDREDRLLKEEWTREDKLLSEARAYSEGREQIGLVDPVTQKILTVKEYKDLAPEARDNLVSTTVNDYTQKAAIVDMEIAASRRRSSDERKDLAQRTKDVLLQARGGPDAQLLPSEELQVYAIEKGIDMSALKPKGKPMSADMLKQVDNILSQDDDYINADTTEKAKMAISFYKRLSALNDGSVSVAFQKAMASPEAAQQAVNDPQFTKFSVEDQEIIKAFAKTVTQPQVPALMPSSPRPDVAGMLGRTEAAPQPTSGYEYGRPGRKLFDVAEDIRRETGTLPDAGMLQQLERQNISGR